MNFQKFISGVSALTIAASAFAGVTAIAANQTITTSYNFSTSSDAPTFATNRNTNTLVAADDTTTTTLSGDKGLLQIIPSGNPGNGYAGSRFDFSNLITDATSFTISYKTYWNTGSRGIVGIGAAADRNKDTIGKQNATNTGLIGTVGHFSSEAYLRATSNGNRAFLSDFNDAKNQWISTVITVDVTNMKYTYTLEGDSKVTVANNAAITSVPDMLEIVTWTPANQTSIELDDLSIAVTKPEAGAATAIAVNYTNSGSPVYTKTIDISAAGKVSGDTSDTFYVAAYVTDTSGNVYSSNLSSYAKTVTLAEGTTSVDVPVTAIANSQYVEYDGDGTLASRDSYASNGSIRTIGAAHTAVATVEEDGIYTLVIATAPNAKTSGDRAYFVSVNDGETAIESAGKVGYYTGAHTYTNIALKTGDNITYYGGAGTVGIDYVLLTKTANYPYAITKAATTNGSFTVSSETATAGTTVTITPTAGEGYEVNTVSVATAAVTDNGNGTYSFTMPASDVTVSVTFVSTFTPTEVSSPEEVSFENVDDGVSAKAYKFTVTPGTNAVTSITVTPDKTHTLTKAVNLISGDVIFGVIFATSTEGVTLPTLTSSMITVE